jgi:quercetin dioxygenase-like cupin family protein
MLDTRSSTEPCSRARPDTAKYGIRRSGDTWEDQTMTMVRNASISSHAGVAVAAALISAVGTWGATRLVATSAAQPAAGVAGPLLTQPLADLPGREVRISLLDREPGSSSARHRHPGHHTFGYVIEGTYEFAINGEPGRTLKAGETFYEPPAAVHSTSRNPSADKRAKILIFMVADQKNPSTVAE